MKADIRNTFTKQILHNYKGAMLFRPFNIRIRLRRRGAYNFTRVMYLFFYVATFISRMHNQIKHFIV